MKVYIILILCHLTTDECLTLDPDIEANSITSCMLTGQHYAADWTQVHPQWRLSKVRCNVGSRPT